jgi:luciferase family oxidoreductase group 1
LINYLGPRNPEAVVRAIPGEGTEVPVWLLGSSTYSAQLAAMLGLPFAFASHFAPTYLHEALQLYRRHFKPSQFLSEPYSLACINVIAADTDEEASLLESSLHMLILGLVRNRRRPLQPPVVSMEGQWTAGEQAAVQQMMHYSFTGSTDTVIKGLQTFADSTGVNEIMVASHIYDAAAKMKSFSLIAPYFKTV